ncbi:hypothetical protein [Streptomyces sp. SBT349]|uniref:AraC-like ligand-binding domain-containing protein n=1 Tax=Streptomyces sp. SBT349 TaxID=1580539 RepID=UPI00066C101A|nr:hypothetical protein [Streptomyces sp. SBT349]
MIESVYRSEDLPAADRFAVWRDLLMKAMCPQEVLVEHAAPFEARMRVVQLNAVNVWKTTSLPVTWRRTPRAIRESDPERYHLTLLLRGGLSVSQGGQEGTHGPFGMYILGTSRPYVATNGPALAVGLEVPRRLLSLPARRTEALVTRRISGRNGPGACWRGRSPG